MDLTPAERAVHITERKRIYELIHGPAKAVGGRARHATEESSATLKSSVAASFTVDTAEKTGQGASTVRRDAQRGEAIGTETLSKVVGTSLDKVEELDALDQFGARVHRAAPSGQVSTRQPGKSMHAGTNSGADLSDR